MKKIIFFQQYNTVLMLRQIQATVLLWHLIVLDNFGPTGTPNATAGIKLWNFLEWKDLSRLLIVRNLPG